MRKSDLILRIVYECLKTITGKALLKGASVIVTDYEDNTFKIDFNFKHDKITSQKY